MDKKLIGLCMNTVSKMAMILPMYASLSPYMLNTTPVQNISRNWSTKVNVFGLKFMSDTSTYIDLFLLIFWDRGSIEYQVYSALF